MPADLWRTNVTPHGTDSCSEQQVALSLAQFPCCACEQQGSGPSQTQTQSRKRFGGVLIPHERLILMRFPWVGIRNTVYGCIFLFKRNVFSFQGLFCLEGCTVRLIHIYICTFLESAILHFLLIKVETQNGTF